MIVFVIAAGLFWTAVVADGYYNAGKRSRSRWYAENGWFKRMPFYRLQVALFVAIAGLAFLLSAWSIAGIALLVGAVRHGQQAVEARRLDG